jgi:hypothetical protein
VWWSIPVILALERLRQEGEFETSISYKASSRLVLALQCDPVSRQNKAEKKRKRIPYP